MAQSVVVLSSQLITTISALAYLRWRGLRGTRLEIVSLYRDDLSHSAKAFQPLLQGLAAEVVMRARCFLRPMAALSSTTRM